MVEFLADPDYVVLHEHKWINLDAAEALAQHTSEHELDLNGLTSISVEVAGALARCQTGLCLNGLTSISVEMAEALAKHTTGLCLFGLTSISVEVAATLAAHRGLLNLGGLTSLSDAAAAEKAWSQLYAGFEDYFSDIDLLIVPGNAVGAFRLEDGIPKTVGGKTMENYVDASLVRSIITLTGHPVIAIPCGLDHLGLPFGVQIVGPRRGDKLLLEAAAALEGRLQTDANIVRPKPNIEDLTL